MEVLDVFNSDAFSMDSLVHSINHVDHKPTRLGDLGLFTLEPISTTSVIIEEDYGTLTLVPVAPRGGVPDPVSRERRKARSFTVPHIPTMSQVMADEVQNVRAFGQANRAAGEMLAVEQVRDRKLAKARMRLEATVEYHRMGAIKGQILDADGSSVLLDLFTAFEVSQSTFGMDLDVSTTDVLKKIREAQRLSLTVLKSQVVTGWHAICSDDFFDAFVGHDELKKLYLNHQAAEVLRGGIAPYSTFPFGNVTWENYRGQVGGVDFVEQGKAYLIPLGVPDLFLHYVSPADYMETVNTLGLPFYAKSELMRMNKGIEIEAQTNPLLICSKPAAVVELDASGS
jgi:hypothetical protein